MCYLNQNFFVSELVSVVVVAVAVAVVVFENIKFLKGK